MPETTIEPGSPAHHACLFFYTNGDEVLDRHAAAAKLQVAPGALDRALQPAVDAGLLTIANSGEHGRVWRAGPRLKHWKPADAGAPVAAPAKKDSRGGKRTRLPPLDISKVMVQIGVPVPQGMQCRKGQTYYDDLLDKLDADGKSLVGLPITYRGAITKAMQTYLQQRPQLAQRSALMVRAIDAATFGIWRQAKPAKGPDKAKA